MSSCMTFAVQNDVPLVSNQSQSLESIDVAFILFLANMHDRVYNNIVYSTVVVHDLLIEECSQLAPQNIVDR
jgi:hypothetical protein